MPEKSSSCSGSTVTNNERTEMNLTSTSKHQPQKLDNQNTVVRKEKKKSHCKWRLIGYILAASFYKTILYSREDQNRNTYLNMV